MRRTIDSFYSHKKRGLPEVNRPMAARFKELEEDDDLEALYQDIGGGRDGFPLRTTDY
jgi:hypothetical protein